MKIYFTASARGYKLYEKYYKKIFQIIEVLGHENIDRDVLEVDAKTFYDGSQKEKETHYKKALKNIKECHMAILEITVPSFSLGYVMEKVSECGKPVRYLSFVFRTFTWLDTVDKFETEEGFGKWEVFGAGGVDVGKYAVLYDYDLTPIAKIALKEVKE